MVRLRENEVQNISYFFDRQAVEPASRPESVSNLIRRDSMIAEQLL